MKRSNSVVSNRSIRLKHNDYSSEVAIANFVNSGSTSGNGGGGNTTPVTNPIIYPKWSWLFDAGTSVPVYLSNNAGGQKAFHCATPGKTARVELYGLTPSAAVASLIQGIFSVTSVGLGVVWGSASAFYLFAYCSDAGAGTYNANFWSLTVFNSLVGGGTGYNTVSFPAPASGVKIDMKIVFSQPSSWLVMYAPAGTNDFVTATLTQVTANNMAGVADGDQNISIGNPLVNVSGNAGRNANKGFVGTLESAIFYLESGAGNSVATFGWNNPPVLTTKQGTEPPFCIYGYDASECVYGSGNAEWFSPNLFTTYGMGTQHAFYGLNKNSAVRSDSTAPARVRV